MRITSAEARLAIAVVIFFVIAFILVIGMKLLQERRATLANAVLSQAYETANMAEQINARLTGIKNYSEATALALRAVNTRRREAFARRTMQSLLARPEVAAVALLTQGGTVELGVGDTQSLAALAGAMPSFDTDHTDARFWIHGVQGQPDIFVLTPTEASNKALLLAVHVSSSALLPASASGQTGTLLANAQGKLVASANGAPPKLVLARLGAMVGSMGPGQARHAIGGFHFRDDSGRRYVVGAASLPRGGLHVFQYRQLHLDGATWRRTLTFFVLMTIAPLLVVSVLCVILLVQLDTLRVARQALADNEKRFQLALEYARGGVWDWNLASNQVYVTDSMAKMLGWKQAATVSVAEFLAMVHPDDRMALHAAMQAAPESGDLDMQFRAANLPIWLHARGRPWRTEHSSSSGRIVGVAIEITEQKGTQARVHAAETRLRAALESMSESFVVWDVKRRLVMCNRKFSDFFNIDPALLRPGTPYEMLEQAADPAIRATHQGTDAGAMELELEDGRWLHLSERPTKDGGLVSIGTDITALKVQETLLLRKEKDLRETVADIEESKKQISELARNYQQEKIRAIEANSSKSEFLANMSHELRTPLNAINGFSEIMQNEMYGPLGDARYKEYVSDILSSGKHLLTLINDILDMSKIEAGKLSLQTETVYVDELIEQCARILRGRTMESGLKVALDIGDLPQIEADPRAVKQVVINLLSNAVKFTPHGGTVSVHAWEENGGVRIKISDTGIGIPEEQLSLICKPFVQVESQHSKSHKGSGLGLALSQSLVLLHGGQFEISSQLGIGTEVSLWLPPVASQSDQDGEPASIWAMAGDESSAVQN